MKKGLAISLTAAGGLLFALLFMPELFPSSGVREFNYRQCDVSTLRRLGLSCQMFAYDHYGNFPDDWSQLLPYVNTQDVLFVTAKNWKHTGSFSNVMQWSDFVLMQGLSTSSPPKRVLAFLPPGQYERWPDAIVLRVDGSVDDLSVGDFTRALNKNYNRGPDKYDCLREL